ncbi:MAG TPA: hypothetical protein VNZ06_02490 [Steroidobacteraceae bacterium]|nr:hypothetical protein [Steroidobacteraceae bacterium]
MYRPCGLWVVLLAGLSGPALSNPTAQPAQWGDFESVRLHASQPGSAAVDSYLQSSRANGDFEVDIDIADIAKPQHGTIMMVAGRVMLSKGLNLTPGSELSALDQPLLMYAVLSSTLSRVLPEGPDATVSRQKISHVDTSIGIAYASANAHGYIPPPWSVEGSLRPAGNRSFEFDLLLKWSAAASRPPVVLNLKGTLQRQSDFRLDDGLEVDGFRVFSLDYHSGYSAKAMTDPPRTIGDIRRQLTTPPKSPTPDKK